MIWCFSDTVCDVYQICFRNGWDVLHYLIYYEVTGLLCLEMFVTVLFYCILFLPDGILSSTEHALALK